MSNKSGEINYGQIISKIKDEINSNGEIWDISERYNEQPKLPIDLFCQRIKGYDKSTKRQEQYYHVFCVASIKTVNEYYKRLLSFCRYYLTMSVIPSPRDLKLTLVVRSDAEIEDEDFYKKNGFGIWKIDKKKDAKGNEALYFREKTEAVPLRDKQITIFLKSFSKRDNYLNWEEKKAVTKEVSQKVRDIASHPIVCECIARHFDQYIREAGEAISGYKEIRFPERLLDAKLMELNTDLKNIAYKDDLVSCLNEHLSDKGDDFEFCSNKLNELWRDYLDSRGYPVIPKKFEVLLKELYPSYRDHFLHQYQNFLIGTYILDGLFENSFIDKKNIDDYSRGWLLASTFHDYARCIQEYDDWITLFFKEMLNIPEPLGLLELKTHYIENSFASSIEYIIHELLEASFVIKDDNKLPTLNDIRQFFYREMTDKKNHAVISSLTLFKRFESSNNTDEFEKVILPAGISIILHDDEIWKTLGGFKNRKATREEEWISNIREAQPLKCFSFENLPLAFILILCDNVQDWGRPIKEEKLGNLFDEAKIHLKNINISDKGVTIQIYFRMLGKTKRLLRYKEDTFNKLVKLLKSDVPFIVEYWDSEKDKRTDYVFQIGGK